MKSFILLLAITLIASENLRSLSFKDYKADKIYFIKSIPVLDNDDYISFIENVGIKDGVGFNKIILSTRSGSIDFGITQIKDSYKRMFSDTKSLIKFNFPPIPDIPITLKVSGKISTQAKESSGSLIVSTSGSLYAEAEADNVAGYSTIVASGKGTILNFNIKYVINTDGSVKRSGTVSSGTISISVTAKAVSGATSIDTYTLWNGWTAS